MVSVGVHDGLQLATGPTWGLSIPAHGTRRAATAVTLLFDTVEVKDLS